MHSSLVFVYYFARVLYCQYFMPFQEFPVFVSMVKEVFGRAELTTSAVGLKESSMQDVLSVFLPKTPTASRKLLSPPKLAFISELLKQQATKNHLVPSTHWMAKVEQLFIQSQLKHGNHVHGITQCSFNLSLPQPQSLNFSMFCTKSY